MKKVSVIIPTFNREKTIEKCLKALNNQTVKDFEVIIVDDESTDNTLSIIKKFRSNARYDIRILKNGSHNISRGRNIGIKNSTSKIIAFIDDDAYAYRNWIEKIIEKFEKKESVFLLGGKSNPAYNNNFSKAIALSDETIRSFFATKITQISSCNMAIRRSKHDVYLFDERFKYTEDVELVVRISKKHQYIYDPEVEVDHESRSNPLQFTKQIYGYGIWKVYFMFLSKDLRFIDFIPALILLFSIVFALKFPFVLLTLPLFSFIEALFILIYRNLNFKLLLNLFLVWLLKNFAWGLGTLVGLVNVVLKSSDFKYIN